MMNTAYLLLLLIVGILGVGLQSVSFFTFCFCPLLLIYTRQRWIHCLFAFIVNTIAVSIGTLGIFDVEYGTPSFTHLPRVIRYSLVTNLVILSSILADHVFFYAKNNSAWARVLAFPCVWTSLWYMHGYWGDRSGYSNGISDWSEWAQIADLGGRSLLEFLLALAGTCILEYQSWMELVLLLKSDALSNSPATTIMNNNQRTQSTTTSSSDKNPNSTPKTTTPSSDRPVSSSSFKTRLIKHPFSLYLALVVLVYIYGGTKSSFRKGSFFQRPTKDWLPTTQPVACVIGPGGFDMELRSDYAYWMNKTTAAAQHGAKLVLWSEEVVLTNTLQDEQQLRDMAIAVAVEHHIYLVIAYDRLDPVNHNMAVLISPQGDILIDYIKANPLPFDENNEPGPGTLLFADTPEFGRIGIAICFDLSVPSFILQAGRNNVDILLQPAYNWGAGGPSNLRNQQLRAVENGFTLFRCISQGISGVIEPVVHGHFEQKTAVVSNQVVLFNLPIQKRIKTLYSDYFGDIIPYACISFSLALFLTLLC